MLCSSLGIPKSQVQEVYAIFGPLALFYSCQAGGNTIVTRVCHVECHRSNPWEKIMYNISIIIIFNQEGWHGVQRIASWLSLAKCKI